VAAAPAIAAPAISGEAIFRIFPASRVFLTELVTREKSARRETSDEGERKGREARVFRRLTTGAIEMRKVLHAAAFIGLASLAGAGQVRANSGGMGDPSVHQRQIQENCDKQRRGEIPGYPSACPSWAIASPAQSGNWR
jgi:hypothetical protein